jgi:hypothetical protein
MGKGGSGFEKKRGCCKFKNRRKKFTPQFKDEAVRM